MNKKILIISLIVAACIGTSAFFVHRQLAFNHVANRIEKLNSQRDDLEQNDLSLQVYIMTNLNALHDYNRKDIPVYQKLVGNEYISAKSTKRRQEIFNHVYKITSNVIETAKTKHPNDVITGNTVNLIAQHTKTMTKINVIIDQINALSNTKHKINTFKIN